MGRKGISPLIGVVLVIGLTISLAIIIFSWAGGFITSETQRSTIEFSKSIQCQNNVEMDISYVCYKEDEALGYRWIDFTVSNQLNSEIIGFYVQITDGEVRDEQSTFTGNLGPLEAKVVSSTSYTDGSELLLKVIIVPKVDAEGSIENCGDKRVEFDDVGLC